MKTFVLPKKVRYTDVCGLHLTFQDVNIRGHKTGFCQVLVTEEGTNGITVNDAYEFHSWEKMKKAYPTLMDFLIALSHNVLWCSKDFQYDRIYYVESIEGHEGLYDEKKVVWFDAQEKFGI